MITLLTIFLILTFLLLVVYGVLAFLAWQKVAVFLTWNTRYESASYESAITKPKVTKPSFKPSKTEQRGRSVKSVDDLVDIGDLDFDTAFKAIDEAAQ